MKNNINAVSLFAGGGIAETYFEKIGIHVKVANELLPERADFYRKTHPYTEMICGDISDEKIFDLVMEKAKKENFIDIVKKLLQITGMSDFLEQ